MTVTELLSQLKDISAPIEPGWWPLASGVYISGAGVLFLVWLIWFFIKRRAANRLYKHSKRELQIIKQGFDDNGDRETLALKLSDWLKRVALSAFPDKQVAGLTGRPWLEFLDRCVGSQEFTEGSGEIFGGAVYGKSPNLPETHAIELCERWLVTIKAYLMERGRDKC